MATCPSCRKRYPDDRRTCADDGETLLPDEAFSAVDPDLAEGQMVGEYRIERKLGAGGFGSVYAAVHPLIGKRAAIKVLDRQYSSNPQMVSRFIAEARAVNQIRHRNIIDIFSFGALEDGRQYYLMELLEGMPFDQYLHRKKRLSPEEAIPLLRQVARALDAAHAAGIVHRDLKPENIYLVFDDEGGVMPKLLDFGIAKLVGEGAAAHKTRTGAPIGTPHYMSPEQCRGKNVDHRTDVYSFGALVHEALTGSPPFDGDSVMDLLLKHTTAPPPPMSSVCADVPAVLDAAVLRMLAKEPAERPESVGAAIDELAAAAAAAGLAVPMPVSRSSGARQSARDPSSVSAAASVKAMTPTEIAAFSSAQTMAQMIALPEASGAKSLPVTSADVRPVPGRRAVLAIGGGALLVGIVGAIAAMRFAPAEAPKPAAPVPVSAAPPSAAPVEASPEPPPAAATASASATPTVTPAPEVSITIQASPPGVEVYLGDQRLGVAPGPLRLPRGEAKQKLTLRAPGYQPADVEVTPSDDAIVSATLAPVVAPASAAPPAPPKPVAPKPSPARPPTSEIENPF